MRFFVPLRIVFKDVSMADNNILSLLKPFGNWKFRKIDEFHFEGHAIGGDYHTDIPEILKVLMDEYPKGSIAFKIFDDAHLSIRTRATKAKKYNRIYTSGCFDVFHYGHLNILKKSKELCDYLIVGVSTDELIEKEKGLRPVIPFKERMRVLQAIKYVDEVIPQEDKNKQNIVDTYQIDAISVGDDWRGRYPEVSCAMEYFPYTASVSSTILKKSLKLIK